MAQLLTESSSAPQKVGNRWRAVLITPGKGSSGIYTEETLRKSGPTAFKKGTHSYVDHPREEGDVRSPKNLIGVLSEDARYEDGVGLVAELEIMPHWKEFVEAVAPHTGLSIYAMGEGGYNDAGEIVVESLVPHTQNSVDLVSYPGRPGSKLADKLYEAAIAMVAEAEPGALKTGDFVSWNSSGGRARGKIERIAKSGSINVPDSDFTINGEEDDPAALIRLYRDGSRTDTLVGHKFSTLTKISSMDESLPSNYRPATLSSVPEGRACGNCIFFNENDVAPDGRARCEKWDEYVEGGAYCNAWEPKQQEASAPMGGKDGTAALTAAATESNKEEGNSDMELKELSDQIAELPNLVAAAVAEALAPEEETEEKEEVDVAAVAEAMVAADLPEVSRKAVYESLRAGGNLAEAIESQKAFVESVKTHFKEQADAAPNREENVIVNTAEKAPRLSDILNVKVGA
jgi:hypothetical protein